MLLTTFAISQIVQQVFLGGSSQSLCDTYFEIAKRSVVVSDKVVAAFGPVRFKRDEQQNLTLLDTTFTTHYNRVKKDLALNEDERTKVGQYSNVDSIVTRYYPPMLVGIFTGKGGTDILSSINISNPSNLSINFDFKLRYIFGSGSDCIKNLNNRGFEKPIEFPSLFGNLWFSCNLAHVSELDFLTAIAQSIDCMGMQSCPN